MNVALDTNAYSDLHSLILCTSDAHFQLLPQIPRC